MKGWYIILSDSENKCEFVSVSAASKLLVLRWYTGQNVKIRIHDFKNQYSEAKEGKEVMCHALSSKGRNIGKPIKIVFK